MVFIPCSLQPLGAQYSTNIQIGAGVLSGRVLCVPAVCLYIVKTWQESTSQEPAGGARPRTSERGCVGARARCPRPAQPPARAGGAPCPFKEADRTTRTFLTGVVRRTRTTFREPKEAFVSLLTLARVLVALRGSCALVGFGRGAPRVSLLRNRPEGLHLLSFRTQHSPSWSKV